MIRHPEHGIREGEKTRQSLVQGKEDGLSELSVMEYYLKERVDKIPALVPACVAITNGDERKESGSSSTINSTIRT